MSHDHGHHGSHDVAIPFSDAEIADLHRQDLAAGASVVTLMSSIFLVGVFLYSVVAMFVASSPLS